MFIPLRDENPTIRFPYITVFLIAVNVLVFLFQIISPEGLNYHILKMGAVPYEITHFKPISFVLSPFGDPVDRISPVLALFTSIFLHAGFLHLIGNMLYLWIFGNNVEDFLGPVRFVLFYLISGLGASIAHILFNPNSQVPMIGASGAIAGILGAYLILFPNARVLTFVFIFIFIRIIPVPAFLVLGLWFIIQVLSVGIGNGVAWMAHIGGFLIGILLVKIYLRKRHQVLVK